MSRAALEDRICYCKRELAELEQTKTDCFSCDRRKYGKNECMKYGAIPSEFMSRTDCPDWEYNSIPF
jgi:hypothetical protein